MLNMYIILITRFNWPHTVWSTRTVEEYLAWIDVRLKLFESYCVKSVQGCSVKPDYWFILCDDRTTNVTDKLNQILANKKINYRLLPYKSLTIREMVQRELNTCTLVYPFEIRTTRLDADDVVSVDFFSEIKKIKIEDNVPTVISAPGGCDYDIDNNLFYFSSYHNNPFLTLVEFIADIKSELQTVYTKMHTDMCEAYKVKYLNTGKPMWSSCMHSCNLANKVNTKKLILTDTDFLLNNFSLKKQDYYYNQ